MARKRGSKWQASVTDADGRRHRPTFDKQVQAEAWEAAARLAVEDGRPLPSTTNASATGGSKTVKLALLGDLFDHVWKTRWRTLKSAPTMKINAETVVNYFGRSKPVRDIGSVDIDEFRAHLTDKGLAQSYINRKCAALSKMLHVAHDAGVVGKVPRFKFPREAQTKFREVNETEEKAILAYWQAAGDQDMADLAMFLVDTGARCWSEACTAHWDAFTKDFTSVTFWVTKTNKPRTIPLTKRLREMLAVRAKTHADRAGPFTGIGKDRSKGRWVAMRDALGLPDVTPHTMRHTCCTRLLRAGVDVKRVMTWMGHTELSTTMRYAQTASNGLEDVLAMLERKAA